MSRALAVALAGLALAGLAFASAAGPAAAAPLEQVKRNGSLHLCANPNSLPYSSRYGSIRGYQVDLAEAIAREMGLGLTVDWIWQRRSAGRVNCDALMDSIVLPAREGARGNIGPIRLTKPYSAGGIALVVRADEGARRFEDLAGKKIGVVAGTVAHRLLDGKGLETSSFVFQDEIVAAVARGEVDAGAVAPQVVAWYLKENPGAPVKIPSGFQYDRDLTWDVAVGLREADQALVDAINGALDRLIARHAIEQIYARYGVAYQPPFGAH